MNSAIVLAFAIGSVAGYGFSVMGWITAGTLLLGTLVVAGATGDVDQVMALAVAGMAILAFNLGLITGLIPRFAARSVA